MTTSVNHAAIVAMLLLPAGAAQAQVATAPQQAAGVDSQVPAADGEILVTARRRSETLQNVPLSVSAFGPDQLAEQNSTTVKDLQHLIPGLQYLDRGTLQTEMTIRGVGGDARNIGVESGVGVYVDGVYIARTSGYNSDLANIAQVEVLRGPQGTLYGKNTIGGVVNIITKKPTDKLEGAFLASYGNYQAIKTQGSVSGPVGSNLFLGATVSTWNREGHITNLFNGQRVNNEDRRGGRAQLRWLATDQLEVNLSADTTRDRQNFILNQMSSPAGVAAPYFRGRFFTNANQRNTVDRDVWGTSATIDYTLESGVVLSSITAYRKIDILVFSDVDQTPLDLFTSGPFTDESKMTSQEFRIASPGDKSLRYVGGLYYFHQNLAGVRVLAINGAVANGGTSDGVVNTDSYAGYFNLDYDLTSNLTATGGVRYTEETKDGRYSQVRPGGLSYNFPDLRRKDSNISWTGSLRYEFSPLLTGYGSVSRGFKSGGFNLDFIGAPRIVANDLIFGPESVVNYEIGLKGRTSSNLFRFSLAAFHMDYEDKQVSQIVSTGASTFPSTQVTNAGGARIRGVEGEMTLRPFEGFTLTANGSYLDAKYTQFAAAASVGGVLVSYAGNRIERTPEWTGSASGTYRYPISGGDIVATGTVTYTGETNLQADNMARNRQDGYTLLDARLGFAATNGVEVAVWGKNLGQKSYRTFARVFAGLDQAVYGEPRTYGIEARYRF